ncbi:ATP-binding protein [Candidatus Uhrbacteria bacterium]|nr:ATP-binding protein [Candidatus Uhrbacteria bacterium]
MAFRPSQLQAPTVPQTALSADQVKLQKYQEREEAKKLLQARQTYQKGIVSVRDIIAPASFEIQPDHLKLGTTYLRTIFVVAYPRYISVGWFAPIINFNATLDIAMHFYPISTEFILKQLRNKVGFLQAQIVADAEKGAPRDPMREVALKDVEQLRDDLTQGTEKFFQFALYVTVYAKEKEQLDRYTQKIEEIFGTSLVYSRKVLYQAEQGFTSTLPIAIDELQVSFNMNSSPCASSFPFISSELTSDNGVLYGVNRHNNSLILFDRFSMQNANMMVFATSGAGKSYTVKLEILRSLMLGVDIIVIDPEMEYKHLAESVGGTYINISLSSDAKINPFDLPRPIRGEEETTADIIRSAVIQMKGMLRLMLGALNTEEDSVIDRAVLEAYAKKDITARTDLTHALQVPVLSDLDQVLQGMVGGEALAEKLKKYTEGTFAGLLNHPTNVDLKSQLVVFSVRDLEDELRPVAIFMLINYIWNVVRSSLKKRILVIDEAWWIMQHDDSAKFLFGITKRARKYYLGITTITQDVTDFLSSEHGKPMLNNSALQMLLRQAPAAIDLVQKTFLLTEGEKYLLLEGNVGEGIFFAGDKHAAIKVVASYTEDQIITSDPRQLLEIEQAKEDFERRRQQSN